MDHHTSRRSALGWIFGGITVVGLGIGASIGIYLYENHSSSLQRQKPTTGGQNTRQPQSTPSDIKYLFRGHSGEVTSLFWSPDGSQLASASLDHSVRLWSLAYQQNTATYTGHTQGVLTVTWSHNNELLASGGEDDRILVWNTAGSTKHSFPKQKGAVTKAIWTANDVKLIISLRSHGLRTLALNNTVTPPGKVLGSYSLALSPNGRYLAMGAENGYITVLDMARPNTPLLLEKLIHTGSVRSLIWSPDNTLLASGGLDKTVRVLDMTTKAITYTLSLAKVVNDISWEPGNTGRLAIASSSDTVAVWNTLTGERTVHTGHQGPVTAVAWGPQALASGSTDQAIIIWNI